MRLAICDDNEMTRKKLAEFCRTYLETQGFSAEKLELAEYDSGENCIEKEEELASDLLLLDIEMEGVNGLRVKEQLLRSQSRTRILFVTSHDECMEDAFGRNVCGFLRKPLCYERVAEKLKLVLQDMEYENSFLDVQTAKTVERVYVRDILYLKAKGKDVDIFTEQRRIGSVSRKGISHWALQLESEGFALSHKSYLVNLAHVQKIKDEVILTGGISVKLSEQRKREFTGRYWDYIAQHTR